MVCLINNKKTEYVVLIPEEKDVFLDFAVKTLTETIQKSTGVILDVVTKTDKKFISLGNTEALQKLNLKVNYGKDGLAVKEIDGNLYLFGQGLYGAIWAVYEFLERKFGYRFFTPDEIKLEKREVIDVEGMDVEYTPTFPNRCSGFGLAKFDLEYATGLKAYAWYGQRLDGKYFWGAWIHNHVQVFLPPIKYYNEHPEWYVQTERFYAEKPEDMKPRWMQLCFSNMEMRDEFAKNLIETVKENSHATHFLIGHEDNEAFCRCEKCQKMIDELTESGLHMDFINDMARRVEAWRVENAPEREILIGGLAYELETSFKAPVKEIDGKLVPIDPRVVAEPNVFMFFAPLSSPEHSRSARCEANKKLAETVTKWTTICSKFGIQLYYGSFRRTFEFVDGIYGIKGNIEFYNDIGAQSFYLEAPSFKGSIAFQAMTLYVLTRLEWDRNLEVDDLIDEFCDNYYKEASPYIKKCFYYLMDYCEKTRKRIEYLTGRRYDYGMCKTDTVPQGFWCLNAVYDASLMLDDAEKAIKDAKYDKETEEKLLDRIEIERLALIYIQLEHFNKELSEYDEARSINCYPKEKILELCDVMEKGIKKYGIRHLKGDDHKGSPLDTIEEWRNRAINSARGWENRTQRLNDIFNS